VHGDRHFDGDAVELPALASDIGTGMPDSTHNTQFNVRADRYFIVESRMKCEQCKALTAVFAFTLPADYESLYTDDDTPDDESGTWDVPGFAAVLSYVDYIPETVIDRVCSMTQHYRLGRNEAGGGTFWMNHCEHCGAQVEEEELHGEFESPFGPMPSEGLEAIRLHEVHEPFTAWAGVQSHDVKPLDS
jgi:hypothetical protein